MSSRAEADVLPEVVLLGANGYLGRHLAQVLKSIECEFLAVGRSATSVDHHRPYVGADMTDLSVLAPALGRARAVLAFAGRTGTLDSFDRADEFLDANERGLLHLLNAIRATGNSPRIVFPSTRLLYRGDSSRDLPEDAPKECNTIYAMNKLACEAYLRMYWMLYGIPYTVLRICVPYGSIVAGGESFGTLQHFIARAERGEDVTIFGDGRQRRTLIHAEDLARIVVSASTAVEAENRVLNVGGPDVLSVSAIARRIAERFGVGVQSVPWPRAHQAIETGDTVLDDTALRSILTPEYEWSFSRWVAHLCAS